MRGGAIEAEEDAVSDGSPCRADIRTVKADCVGRNVFEFSKLGVFGGGGDADFALPGGSDGPVGLDVSGHDFDCTLVCYFGLGVPRNEWRSVDKNWLC
mmetsp:Transcript_25050/g.54169  ORF Transcript_25050/g.54169 Transcript_25050/m.54169 type:complete len:98 (+) Transcript_25050:561-854(+)